MYEYLLHHPQPPLVIPPPKPPAPKAEQLPTRAQARDKARKEKEELRDWWDDLPEEKRQEIRDTKYWVEKPKEKKKKPEKKKPEKKPAKPAADSEEDEKFVPEVHQPDRRPLGKPDWNTYQGPQQWAMVEM